MDFLPIFLNLKGARCLVVGGGAVAARKAGLLLECGARVVVVAPELGETLAAEKSAGRIEHVAARFADDHLAGATIVIAATDDPAVNAAVSQAAKARDLPVNVVDSPELCSFIFPSIVDRSPMIVAVSTGGASPVLARLMRAKLETLLPATYGRLAQLAQGLRDRVKRHFANPAQRRIFWERMLGGTFADMVLSGKATEAEKYFGEQRVVALQFPDAIRECRVVGGWEDTLPVFRPGQRVLVMEGPQFSTLLVHRLIRLGGTRQEMLAEPSSVGGCGVLLRDLGADLAVVLAGLPSMNCDTDQHGFLRQIDDAHELLLKLLRSNPLDGFCPARVDVMKLINRGSSCPRARCKAWSNPEFR